MKSGEIGIAQSITQLQGYIKTLEDGDSRSENIKGHAEALIGELNALQACLEEHKKRDEGYCNRIDKALYWVIDDVLTERFATNSELELDKRKINMKEFNQDGYNHGSIGRFIEVLKSPSELKEAKEFKRSMHHICFALSKMAKWIGGFAATGCLVGAGVAAFFGLPILVTTIIGGAAGGVPIALYGIFGHEGYQTPLEEKLLAVKSRIVELQIAKNRPPASPVRLESMAWNSAIFSS